MDQQTDSLLPRTADLEKLTKLKFLFQTIGIILISLDGILYILIHILDLITSSYEIKKYALEISLCSFLTIFLIIIIIMIIKNRNKILKFLAFSYLIFGIILISLLMIFEIRDILFPNSMKPIRPIQNFDEAISYFTFISIFIRISAITFTFLFIYFSSKYQKSLKDKILNSMTNTSDNNNKVESENLFFRQKEIKNEEIRNSLNNAESNYTSTADEKNMLDETSIRVNMDELNEKIKAGEIFTDNSSRASNYNPYNMII